MSDEYEDTVECYGRFDIQARICRKYCALRLRCAVEQSQQMRIEQLEDLMNSYEATTNIQ
ncbi:hypothetical protein HNR65_002114 [Desulfosalsimonas propionicica]|uniref:Uncharacterized protein n=1 Tax=Desulfosalsimonas propionicica TaxID=332175 RepID=A0A7W0C9T6_9BACT|nr:hypothetical protein [Desulfosalsimonas propionicica]MBA2881783.1 hypothetical protein [Desulfosalsimonas propionicica]